MLLNDAIGAGGLGFDYRADQIGTVSPLLRSFSKLCRPGATPRRWASPLVTRFGVIGYHVYNENLIILFKHFFAFSPGFFSSVTIFLVLISHVLSFLFFFKNHYGNGDADLPLHLHQDPFLPNTFPQLRAKHHVAIP